LFPSLAEAHRLECAECGSKVQGAELEESGWLVLLRNPKEPRGEKEGVVWVEERGEKERELITAGSREASLAEPAAAAAVPFPLPSSSGPAWPFGSSAQQAAPASDTEASQSPPVPAASTSTVRVPKGELFY
jgi:hypothetical protein